jgi:hypothetical protein
VTFEEILNEAVAMLQRQSRVSYRALKRQFDLDDDYLEDLKNEILYTQSLVLEDGERGLIWTSEVAPKQDRAKSSLSWEKQGSESHGCCWNSIGSSTVEKRPGSKAMRCPLVKPWHFTR